MSRKAAAPMNITTGGVVAHGDAGFHWLRIQNDDTRAAGAKDEWNDSWCRALQVRTFPPLRPCPFVAPRPTPNAE